MLRGFRFGLLIISYLLVQQPEQTTSGGTMNVIEYILWNGILVINNFNIQNLSEHKYLEMFWRF